VADQTHSWIFTQTQEETAAAKAPAPNADDSR